MRFKAALCAALLGGLVVGEEATASTFLTQEFRCPVGGKTFKATVMASWSSFGSRPDGKPYDSGRAPMVECADNGFVFYKTAFTKAEEAALTPLVLGADYQALRAGDTAEYRSAWLQQRMGADPNTVAGALLAASWSSDADQARKARYQQEFVEAALRAPRPIMLLRRANALRELGRHSESDAVLDALTPQIPSVSEAAERKAYGEMIAGLRTLNREGNRASEPVILVPEVTAAYLCVRAERSLSASEQARCATPELRKLAAEFEMEMPKRR